MIIYGFYSDFLRFYLSSTLKTYFFPNICVSLERGYIKQLFFAKHSYICEVFKEF